MYREAEKSIQIGSLITKEISGNLKEEERLLLQQWLSESEQHQETYTRCLDRATQLKSYNQLDLFDSEHAFKVIKKQLTTPPTPSYRPLYMRMLPYLATAGIVLLILFSWYFLHSSMQTNTSPTELANDYAPAAKKATIVLSDGRTFDLNDVDNEIVIHAQELQDGQGNHVADMTSVNFAKIQTPRGGIYEVTLPDGTHVKLNAASSLTYPTVFGKEKREVSLDGEAYFEVAHSPQKPFVVRSNNQQVTVLGTHFNVSAYAGSRATQTTLLEGKVRVQLLNNTQEILLSPGQQSAANGAEISKRNVDVEQELSWLYGKFNFQGKKLREVMAELSRWYNIDVEYEGNVPDIEFFGGTFRNSKLSNILSILHSQQMNYRLTADGKLIISMAKQNNP